MVGSLLDTLGKITRRPPTLVEENRAVWGPFTPILSPANYRLVIERLSPGEFAHHLDARPKDSAEEEAFAQVGVGAASPRPQAGSFSADVDHLHLLNPDVPPPT